MRARGRITAVAAGAIAVAIAGTLLAPLGASSAPGAASAFVRVNQVGYPATATKRAYLLASGTETGATFVVRNTAGAAVGGGTVGADLGSWSNAFPHVYAIDFDALATAGTYRITVDGPIPASSPSFRVAAGASLYGAAMRNARSFYRNQRDGAGYIASPLRAAPAHLNDRHAMTYLTPNANSSGRFSGDLSPLNVRMDASGGWWDAGDYLKFVQTTSYTVAVLLHGVRTFPAQMGPGSAADFTAEAKFGTRWLMKMWNDRTSTLYYQVGIGSGNSGIVGDHDIWRLPQDDDTYGGSDPRYRYIRERPVFRVAPPGSPVSPNLAGRLAAVFAQCFVVFETSDPSFANRCLVAGEHVFDLADTNPGPLLTVIPFSFYPEDEWQSDLELGATELAIAVASGGAPSGLPHTDPHFYLVKAAHWASAYMSSPFDASDTLNLYDVSGLAHYELAGAIDQAGAPSDLETTRAALVADLRKAVDGALAQGATDPFGFGFPWDTWDTTSHGAGLSVMASEVNELTGTQTYPTQSGRWLANILGANAWGVSLIVGDGTTFPHCLQHQVANIAGSLDGTAPILAGAVVEGPNRTLYRGSLSGMRACPTDGLDVFGAFSSTAKFKDDAESFSTVEPAIDLSATSPLAFARQMADRT
jgi:endoglucanase